MKRPFTRHCDECEHSSWSGEGLLALAHKCAKGHKPRFFMRPMDETAGFKRKCEDYKISDTSMRRIEADMWTSIQDAKERR